MTLERVHLAPTGSQTRPGVGTSITSRGRQNVRLNATWPSSVYVFRATSGYLGLFWYYQSRLLQTAGRVSSNASYLDL